ncbi:hypothetical protein G6O69_24980 [Pseudenhygromyxa sp. WMMC2535]|uniref:hypothetical protein n=1 Tax=Pseudenhygromyxa sp. WMMC2535 TaxID=2712867 RepID=UPI0015573431|nr:hypothetical protein [Pseudenhygromyxa sp. WMMC2535]NVB41118.1 hypothetical protein [Pseudenhygromyxa sp. WMMC2535]
MVDPSYARRGRALAPVGIAWAGTLESTVAYLSEGQPTGAAWRLFLDRIRRANRPLLLRLSDGTQLDARAREELAEALGSTRVSLVSRGSQKHSEATALRWLGVEAEHFEPRELRRAASFLGVDLNKVKAALAGLDGAAA